LKKITLQSKITFSFSILLFCFSTNEISAQDTIKKPTELKEVAIIKTKKAIDVKPDRTVFSVADQPSLNSGTLQETIKKLPGLISSEVAGMMYQGKLLDVYLDGRPLNISESELTSFLDGMPANSVDKIEIITQPGAEFPATSGAAILNIITNKNAKKYLSATYTNSSAVTSYDKKRYRTSNSILLNAKNKYFGWQLNFGQNYRENALWTEFNRTDTQTVLSNTKADRTNRNNFLKSGLTFDIKKDKLLLNYDLNSTNNDNQTDGFGEGFVTSDKGKSHQTRHDATLTYQKRFEKKDQKLDFVFNINNNKNDYNLFSNILSNKILDNFSEQKDINAKIDYSQGIKILDEGKISFGVLFDKLDFDAKSFNTNNLQYNRTTTSGYLEFNTKLKSFDFILGSRLEKYKIDGKTSLSNLTEFNQTRFFPNATIQYNVSPQIFFNVNYNKKITLPTTSALNPNNTTYQNQNLNTVGNPNLQPTIFDNFEVKLSAFDYAYLGYSLNSAKNQVVERIDLIGNQVQNTNLNVSEIKIHNFNFAIPIPYMLFTKGLAETMKFEFNPDTINFLYFYTGYQYQQIPDLKTKGFWTFNLMSQIILPNKITFTANYGVSNSGGNQFYFVAEKPTDQYLDITFSKKLLKDQLSISINALDILNSERSIYRTVNEPLLSYNKNDTRRFGITLTYKLPTKSKVAVEEPSLNENQNIEKRQMNK
jgi:Outer membrane protein beta-barrel family